jgi:hypothetical protein
MEDRCLIQPQRVLWLAGGAGRGRTDTPSAEFSTITTRLAPEARLAGTRIQSADAAYSTPTLTPETVPDPSASRAVVAGTCGITSEGSRPPPR